MKIECHYMQQRRRTTTTLYLPYWLGLIHRHRTPPTTPDAHSPETNFNLHFNLDINCLLSVLD